MILEIVPFDVSFLDLSFKWLNDKDIKTLTNTPDFDKEQQKQWFENIGSKKDYLFWGVQTQKIKIGACGLKNITTEDCEYWGYIGEKAFWGNGLGRQMLFLMENKAYELGLKRIWLKVIDTNTRAKSLYSNCGFNIENVQGNTIIMSKYI